MTSPVIPAVRAHPRTSNNEDALRSGHLLEPAGEKKHQQDPRPSQDGQCGEKDTVVSKILTKKIFGQAGSHEHGWVINGDEVGLGMEDGGTPCNQQKRHCWLRFNCSTSVFSLEPLQHRLGFFRMSNRPRTSGLPPKSVIVITGGTGYIGSHCVAKLLEHPNNYFIRACVRSDAKAAPLIEYVEGKFGKGRLETVLVEDMMKPGAYDRAIKEDVKGVVHVAADVSFQPHWEKVVEPTKVSCGRMLDDCAALPVRRQADSGAAYRSVFNRTARP